MRPGVDVPEGAVVVDIDPHGPGYGKLAEGDIIVEANGKRIRDAEDLAGVLSTADAQVLLVVENIRTEQRRYVAIDLTVH